MSQEKVEITRQVVEAINRLDRDAWLRLQDPELEFRADPEWPESETVRGRDAVWEFLTDSCRSLGTRRRRDGRGHRRREGPASGPVDATRSGQDERDSSRARLLVRNEAPRKEGSRHL